MLALSSNEVTQVQQGKVVGNLTVAQLQGEGFDTELRWN